MAITPQSLSWIQAPCCAARGRDRQTSATTTTALTCGEADTMTTPRLWLKGTRLPRSASNYVDLISRFAGCLSVPPTDNKLEHAGRSGKIHQRTLGRPRVRGRPEPGFVIAQNHLRRAGEWTRQTRRPVATSLPEPAITSTRRKLNSPLWQGKESKIKLTAIPDTWSVGGTSKRMF